MYTTVPKKQEGCTFKDSHPKCFITTNFDKLHHEAVAMGGERGEVLTACFRDIQSQRSIRMEFVIYIMILFDVTDYPLLESWYFSRRIFAPVYFTRIIVRQLFESPSQPALRVSLPPQQYCKYD